MKVLTPDGSPVPDEIATAKKQAVVAALVEQALIDSDYHDALQIAAFNMLGFTAGRQGRPVEDIVALLLPTAQSARDHYIRRVAQ